MAEKVNFGDELVEPQEKTRRVGAVFSSVARRYDVMNDLMSGGMHRLWKDRFVARVKPRPGEEILDTAGGTGDVGDVPDAEHDRVGIEDRVGEAQCFGILNLPREAGQAAILGALPADLKHVGVDIGDGH